MKTDPSVIDISHYQATPDFGQVAAGGILGVILKATEGLNYVDPTFAARRQAAQDAGLLTASYHFLRPGDFDDQMSHYMDTVRPVYGERMIIDFEDDSLALDDLESAVDSLLEAELDLQVTVYGGSVLKQVLDSPCEYLANNTSLWLAQYTTGTPTWPKSTWKYWSLWQYSDHGQVPGLAGSVDINRFNGDDEALKAWLSPAQAPAPGPTPEVVTVTLSIASDKPVNLVVSTGANVTLTLS